MRIQMKINMFNSNKKPYVEARDGAIPPKKQRNVKCEKCGLTMAGTESWYVPKTTDYLCSGHNKRVTDLELLRQEEIQMDDVLLISDVSEKKSKQIRVGDLVNFLKNHI